MHMWTGVIAFTDDLLPVVGEFGGCPATTSCLASTGFTLGPIIARMLAEHLAERRPARRRLPAAPVRTRPDRPALTSG